MYRHYPKIETKRLLLRAIEKSDAQALYKTFSDEKAMKYFGMYPMNTMAEVVQLIENFHMTFNNQAGIRLAIVSKDTQQVMGTCGFHQYSQRHARAEVGFELNGAYQHQGYAREAVEALIKWGFDVVGLHRIEAVTYPENNASMTLLEKLGFEKEGLLRDYVILRDQPQDLWMYSLLQEDYRTMMEKRHED